MNLFLNIVILCVMLDNNAENKRHNLAVEQHYKESSRESNM